MTENEAKPTKLVPAGWNEEFAKTGKVEALEMLNGATVLEQDGFTSDFTCAAQAASVPQTITHEGVTFDLSKAQDAPTPGLAGLLDGATLKEVVKGPKRKSGKFGEGTLSFLNRHARRKLEAFEKSAKWARMIRNGDNAAVRKLNREGREFQAKRDKFGDPED